MSIKRLLRHRNLLQSPICCQGFTLIELMVVIMLLSTIALFAAPNLSKWLHRNRVDRAAQDFLSHIAYARQKAITLGCPIVLCPADTTGQCSVTTPHCGKNHAIAHNWGCGYAVRVYPFADAPSFSRPALLKIWHLDGDIRITSSPTPLIFRPPTGQVLPGIRHFEFTPYTTDTASLADSPRRCIYIAAGGRVRLTHSACKPI